MDLKKKKTTATDLCIGQIITLLFNDGNHNQIKAWNQIKDSHPYWILDRIGPHWKQMHSFGKDDLKAILWHTHNKWNPSEGLTVLLNLQVFFLFFCFYWGHLRSVLGRPLKTDRCDGLHSGDLWARRQGGRWRTGGELGAKAGDLAVLADLCVWSKEFLTLPLLNFCQM